MPNTDWEWSTENSDWYRLEQDAATGQWITIWEKEEQARPRLDSAASAQQTVYVQREPYPEPRYGEYTAQSTGPYQSSYDTGPISPAAAYTSAFASGAGHGHPARFPTYSEFDDPQNQGTVLQAGPVNYDQSNTSAGHEGYSGYDRGYEDQNAGYRQEVGYENSDQYTHQYPAAGANESRVDEPPPQSEEYVMTGANQTSLDALPPLRKGDSIKGTHGKQERLDPSFKKRNNPDQFFTEGRVFAVLHTEGMGEDTKVTPRNVDVNITEGNITEVKYGERVYTNIRRFVVAIPNRGFCYACPISTYGGRATLKPGVDKRAHGVIYTEAPCLLRGEHIEKNPIRLIPADGRIKLKAESRVNYALLHPIQHNVKVKDLGWIDPPDVQKLAGHWRMEMRRVTKLDN